MNVDCFDLAVWSLRRFLVLAWSFRPIHVASILPHQCIVGRIIPISDRRHFHLWKGTLITKHIICEARARKLLCFREDVDFLT